MQTYSPTPESSGSEAKASHEAKLRLLQTGRRRLHPGFRLKKILRLAPDTRMPSGQDLRTAAIRAVMKRRVASFRSSRGVEFASDSCCNKVPHNRWIKTHNVIIIELNQTEDCKTGLVKLNSRYWQHCISTKISGKIHFLTLSSF